MAPRKEGKSRMKPGQNNLRKPLTVQLNSDDPELRRLAEEQIRLALERNDGNMTAAAEELAISWFTFYRNVRQAKLQKYAAKLRRQARIPGRRAH